MKINLISRDNGAGLSTDMDLLEGIFTEAGHKVEKIDWASHKMDHCDVGIFLELLNPKLLRYMDNAIGVFNMEWFMSQWARFMNNMTQLWAKSDEAYDIFIRSGFRKTSYKTGFVSRDMYIPGVEKQERCLHLKGHSDLKNTQAVLEAWRRHPSLPPLTIISNNPIDRIPNGVTVLSHVPTDELARLMNESYIHLCPSRTEGWGHYITEGLSTGAMVVATNASPMNEHVSSKWGMLVEPRGKIPRGLVHEWDVHPDAIAEAIFAAMRLSQEERELRSALARDHVAYRNRQFKEYALHLLGEL